MDLDKIKQQMIDAITKQKHIFLDFAEEAIANYAEDNDVGPADDPQVFTSWVATVMLESQLAGIEFAIETLKEGTH